MGNFSGFNTALDSATIDLMTQHIVHGNEVQFIRGLEFDLNLRVNPNFSRYGTILVFKRNFFFTRKENSYRDVVACDRIQLPQFPKYTDCYILYIAVHRNVRRKSTAKY